MSQPKFVPGTVLIDRYEIKNFHAAGGMQEVYLAHDHTLNRTVAVKTPKTGVVDRRFRRGAEMGARVNHPNVASTLDYIEYDDVTFLVEEFIYGIDLGKRLDSEISFLDPSLAAHVIYHIAKALVEAHRTGICHRDLKPSNIMTSFDPSISSIKLTDFGIAKLAESEIAAEMRAFDEDQATLLTSNTLLGAVPYMAPECWVDWKAAGQPMDVWALGCIAYHLLAGAPPFGIGRNAIFAVGRLEVTGITLAKPTWYGTHKVTEVLENQLWEIISGCLRYEPGERLTAAQVVEQCNLLCYPSTDRRTGRINTFNVRYHGGGNGSFGFISDDDGVNNWFFHGSDFFGQDRPEAGQRVCFSVYPGWPYSRCSPVLQVKPNQPQTFY